LSIVAAVAEAHGGTARYERGSGGGARFEVRIPFDGEDVGATAPPIERADSPPA
jgi:signal transduction histidine kinase